MSILKQLLLTLLVLCTALVGWVYFFPSAIDTLASRNLDHPALRAIAELNSASAEKENSANPSSPRRGRQALVITQPVQTAIINDRLSAIGNGRAIQSVTVTPLVSGQIVELPIRSGQPVEMGEVIARLDSKSEQLALEKAELEASELRKKTERTRALFEKGSATVSSLETAETDLANAELAVREAKLALERRTIPSPIRGVVGIVAASVGEFVTNQSEIVTIDNREAIMVEFFVPERFATAIETGAAVTASSVARPGEVFSGEIAAIDNRVDVASRTLRIRARIANTEDRLRAGMAFKVTMQFDGDSYPAVDPLAVQWDSKGSFVWRVDEEGKARKLYARIVQRNPESVLVEADLKVGDRVVTEGIQNVREGVSVTSPGDADEKPLAVRNSLAG